MREEGIEGAGEVGDRDPLNAAMDAIAEHGIDEIIVSTLPAPVLGLAAARPDRARSQDETGLPVDARGRRPRRARACRSTSRSWSPTRPPRATSWSTGSRSSPRTGPHRFIVVVPQDGGDGPRRQGRARAPRARCSPRSSEDGIVAAGHDRRPRSVHRDDERRAVLPHLRDRHLDAARETARAGWPTSSSSACTTPTNKPVEHVESAEPTGGAPDGSRRPRGRATHEHEHHGPPPANRSSRVDPPLLGMLLFIISRGHGLRGLLHGLLLHPGRARAPSGRPRGPSCRS